MSLGTCGSIVGPALIYCLKGNEKARKSLTLADCKDKFSEKSPNFAECKQMIGGGGDDGGTSPVPSGGLDPLSKFADWIKGYAKDVLGDISDGGTLSGFLTDTATGPTKALFQLAWALGIFIAIGITAWLVLKNTVPRDGGRNLSEMMSSLGGVVLAIVLMQAVPLALSQLAELVADQALVGASETSKDPAGGLFTATSKALDGGGGGPIGTALLSLWSILVGGALNILYAFRAAAILLMLAVSPLVIATLAQGRASRTTITWLKVYAWLCFFPVLVSVGGAISPVFGSGSLGTAVALGALTLLVYGSWLLITRTVKTAKSTVVAHPVYQTANATAHAAAERIERHTK